MSKDISSPRGGSVQTTCVSPGLSRRLLVTGGIAAAGLQLAGCDLSSGRDREATEDATGNNASDFRLPIEGHLPPLDGATGWLNSPPQSPDSLAGKVVLFDFCTYTCINWIRTLPYRRAWAQRYREHGLVLIGVHTPEFEFEKDVARVVPALGGFGVDYPVALDSEYRVWDAFRNNYWPALYFMDAEGLIRHHFFGEGNYDRLERIIQHLLRKAGQEPPTSLAEVEVSGLEVAADWENLKSPETYLGYQRGHNFDSPGNPRFDEVAEYKIPEHLELNSWALAGSWTVGATSISLASPGGRISFRFHARDMHLVMGPEMVGRSVQFRVLLDGREPGPDHGIDIDALGNGRTDAQRMYQLIRQSETITERHVVIEFAEQGIAAFAFTFG